MSKRGINRSTLKFLAARRIEAGVDVTATFEAPKTSGEVGSYNVQLTIEANTKGVISAHFVLRNRADGAFVLQHIPSKDSQGSLAREVRDVFLKSPAWKILKDREPDRSYIVDHQGKPTQHSTRTR